MNRDPLAQPHRSIGGGTRFCDCLDRRVLGRVQAIAASRAVGDRGRGTRIVRLARGLPFTSPDLYELDEIRQLTQAIKQIVRALRILFVVTLAAMVALVVLKPLTAALAVAVPQPYSRYLIQYVALGLMGLVVGFVFSRMYSIVVGDYDLTLLQSKFLERAVERKQARRFEDRVIQPGADGFKSPEGFGRVIQ